MEGVTPGACKHLSCSHCSLVACRAAQGWSPLHHRSLLIMPVTMTACPPYSPTASDLLWTRKHSNKLVTDVGLRELEPNSSSGRVPIRGSCPDPPPPPRVCKWTSFPGGRGWEGRGAGAQRGYVSRLSFAQEGSFQHPSSID